MTLPPMPPIPTLYVRALPDNEQPAASNIFRHLFFLYGYIRDAEAALSLFDFSAELVHGAIEDKDSDLISRFSQWQIIAARGFVLEVYNFSGARTGINSALNKCKVLSSVVSRHITAANGLFNSSFPAWEEMRHIAAHAEDKKNLEGSLARHAVKGPFSVGGMEIAGGPQSIVSLGDVLEGRIYSGSWNGKAFSCEISRASVDCLLAAQTAFFGAFEHADSWAKDQAAKRQLPPSSVGDAPKADG